MGRTDGTDRTDVCTDSSDTICPPNENGGGIKKTDGHTDRHRDGRTDGGIIIVHI